MTNIKNGKLCLVHHFKPAVDNQGNPLDHLSEEGLAMGKPLRQIHCKAGLQPCAFAVTPCHITRQSLNASYPGQHTGIYRAFDYRTYATGTSDEERQRSAELIWKPAMASTTIAETIALLGDGTGQRIYQGVTEAYRRFIWTSLNAGTMAIFDPGRLLELGIPEAYQRTCAPMREGDTLIIEWEADTIKGVITFGTVSALPFS